MGDDLKRRLAGIRYLSLWVLGVRRHPPGPPACQCLPVSSTFGCCPPVPPLGLLRPVTLADWSAASAYLATEMHRFHLVADLEPSCGLLWLGRSVLVPEPRRPGAKTHDTLEPLRGPRRWC